jgi:hypothetical protein
MASASFSHSRQNPNQLAKPFRHLSQMAFSVSVPVSLAGVQSRRGRATQHTVFVGRVALVAFETGVVVARHCLEVKTFVEEGVCSARSAARASTSTRGACLHAPLLRSWRHARKARNATAVATVCDGYGRGPVRPGPLRSASERRASVRTGTHTRKCSASSHRG